MAKKVPSQEKASAKQKSGATKLTGEFDHFSRPMALTPVNHECLITPAEAALEYRSRRKELNQRFLDARNVLDRWWPQLKKRRDYKDGHLNGISVRFRTKFGQIVSPLQVAIVFNVQRKLCDQDLNRAGYACLTSREGVPVKVVEGGFQLLRRTPYRTPSAIGPLNPLDLSSTLMGGAAIAPPEDHNSFGTLGIVVGYDRQAHFGLSAQHVVSGAVDQLGPHSTFRGIGEVSASRPPLLNYTHHKITESLDCCLINLRSDTDNELILPASGVWVREIERIRRDVGSDQGTLPVYFSSRRMIESDRDFPIYKFGAGSGYLARGVIEAVDRRQVGIHGVNYVNNFSVILAEDGNRAFAAPGDSGSVLLLQARVHGQPALIAAGILFACLENNSAVGLACNMSHVLKSLNLRFPKVRTISRWTR
jgi:hypothetical protein